MAMHDDSFRNSTDRAADKASLAANKAVHGHDEPRTTGDAVGEATGGLAGAATGAALGSLGGPIGTIIGGIAGAATGWWTGRAVSEAASTFDRDEPNYRQHFSSSSTSRNDMSYDRARPAYQVGHLAGMNPDYQGRSFDDVEVDLRRGWETGARDTHGDWNDVRDYARGAFERGQQHRLTLSEEQLAVGKRQVQAGEVEVHKTVETRQVQETVPLVHEEVTIERRPLTGADAHVGNLTIGEERIEVPLMAEEAVVEKRVVPVEEVVIRKEAVTEERVVEDTVRRERLATEGLDQARMGASGTSTGVGSTGLGIDRDAHLSGAQDRAHDSGIMDRLADKLDDVKDRVDGNPASRPGPDATDRRI